MSQSVFSDSTEAPPAYNSDELQRRKNRLPPVEEESDVEDEELIEETNEENPQELIKAIIQDVLQEENAEYKENINEILKKTQEISNDIGEMKKTDEIKNLTKSIEEIQASLEISNSNSDSMNKRLDDLVSSENYEELKNRIERIHESMNDERDMLNVRLDELKHAKNFEELEKKVNELKQSSPEIIVPIDELKKAVNMEDLNNRIDQLKKQIDKNQRQFNEELDDINNAKDYGELEDKVKALKAQFKSTATKQDMKSVIDKIGDINIKLYKITQTLKDKTDSKTLRKIIQQLDNNNKRLMKLNDQKNTTDMTLKAFSKRIKDVNKQMDKIYKESLTHVKSIKKELKDFQTKKGKEQEENVFKLLNQMLQKIQNRQVQVKEKLMKDIDVLRSHVMSQNDKIIKGQNEQKGILQTIQKDLKKSDKERSQIQKQLIKLRNEPKPVEKSLPPSSSSSSSSSSSGKRSRDEEYQESKKRLKEVEVEEAPHVINISEWVERDPTLYFVTLVAGELSRETEDMLKVTFKALIPRTQYKYYSIKAKFSNELIAAWEKVMSKVMAFCGDDHMNREDVFTEYIKNPFFLQIFSEYCAFVISSKSSEMMLDYKSSKMINTIKSKSDYYSYKLMEALWNMRKLKPAQEKKYRFIHQKRRMKLVMS